jgi:hypothetical protein
LPLRRFLKQGLAGDREEPADRPVRIVRRAGVKPSPRLYQNLRASRETELCERFPIHVVAEWLGNSPKTGLAHYTQVKEQLYRKALQNPGQQGAESARIAPQEETGELTDCEALRDIAMEGIAMQGLLMTPTGFEPVSQP